MQKLIAEFQEKSMQVLKGSKREYGKAKDMYNEEALSKYEQQLINETEKKLKKIKNEFLSKANVLVDKKIQQADAEEEKFKIKDNLEYIRFHMEAKLKYDVLPLHEIIKEMENIENPVEFAVAKQTALELAGRQERIELYKMTYASPVTKEIRQDKLFIRELEMNVNQYVLPMYINVREYVTEKSMSNYYFNNNNIEDVSDMYFGGNR